jgi:hypothetical protein
VANSHLNVQVSLRKGETAVIGRLRSRRVEGEMGVP